MRPAARAPVLAADPCGTPHRSTPLIGSEVNPVLKALREHAIEVTAIHNHMFDDEPHLYFMHFWANDDAVKLAEGLKAALAQINIVRS